MVARRDPENARFDATRRARTVGLFCVALSCAIGTPAEAQESQPTATPATTAFDSWLAATRDPLGRSCDRRGSEGDGARIVLACGEAGLWIVEPTATGSFALIDSRDLGGEVVGLFVQGGRVWAEISYREARPVLRQTGSTRAFPAPTSEPGAPPQPVAPPPPLPTAPVVPPSRQGKVLEAALGEVVINLGQRDGIQHGARIELSVATTDSVGGERAVRTQVAAVGRVTSVSEGFARVRLGLNERVPVGATARLVERNPSESWVSPPRAAGLWELAFRARPFVALEGLGGGILTQASVGYRFESPFRLTLELHPFAYANGQSSPAVIPATTFVAASYDRDVFELGMGVGLTTVKDAAFVASSGTGTLVMQRLRLGARDGLNLDLRSDVVLFHSRFDFAGLVGSSLIPVGASFWLVVEGGGGSAGYGYGELGVRALMRGNGGPGSLFLTVTLGGVGVFENRHTLCGGQGFVYDCGTTTTYAGPMLGVGGEWRL